jgi:hypothetical protein
MHDGTGAGGKFADEAKHIADELKPVLGTLKDIGGFLVAHPEVGLVLGGGIGAAKVASQVLRAAVGAERAATKALTRRRSQADPGVRRQRWARREAPGQQHPRRQIRRVVQGDAAAEGHRPHCARRRHDRSAGSRSPASRRQQAELPRLHRRDRARTPRSGSKGLRDGNPEFVKLRDYIDKLAQQSGGPFTADAKRAAAMLDQLTGSARKSSSAIRDAADSNGALLQAQRRTIASADNARLEDPRDHARRRRRRRRDAPPRADDPGPPDQGAHRHHRVGLRDVPDRPAPRRQGGRPRSAATARPSSSAPGAASGAFIAARAAPATSSRCGRSPARWSSPSASRRCSARAHPRRR